MSAATAALPTNEHKVAQMNVVAAGSAQHASVLWLPTSSQEYKEIMERKPETSSPLSVTQLRLPPAAPKWKNEGFVARVWLPFSVGMVMLSILVMRIKPWLEPNRVLQVHQMVCIMAFVLVLIAVWCRDLRHPLSVAATLFASAASTSSSPPAWRGSGIASSVPTSATPTVEQDITAETHGGSSPSPQRQTEFAKRARLLDSRHVMSPSAAPSSPVPPVATGSQPVPSSMVPASVVVAPKPEVEAIPVTVKWFWEQVMATLLCVDWLAGVAMAFMFVSRFCICWWKIQGMPSPNGDTPVIDENNKMQAYEYNLEVSRRLFMWLFPFIGISSHPSSAHWQYHAVVGRAFLTGPWFDH
jgi:hypothetical protein